RTSVVAGACAYPDAHTRKSITTGLPARPRNAFSVIRVLKQANRQSVRKPVWAVSVIWVCCCMTLIALNKPPVLLMKKICIEHDCRYFLIGMDEVSWVRP